MTPLLSASSTMVTHLHTDGRLFNWISGADNLELNKLERVEFIVDFRRNTPALFGICLVQIPNQTKEDYNGQYGMLRGLLVLPCPPVSPPE